MPHSTESHYERLARDYDRNWEHSPEYVEWMNRRIETELAVSPGDRVADVGGGTGLFVKRLLPRTTPEAPIVCIDPSQAMLDRLPADPRLVPVCATAEEVAEGKVALPYDQLDAILCKEMIHHVADIPAMMNGLAELLAPGGRLLVVTLPPKLEYPLFQAALDRFADGQPEPDGIALAMREAGLTAGVSSDEFMAVVEPDHYLELVAHRWMSVLSTFTDAELEAGLAEMRERHTGTPWRYPDRFAFILGRKP